MKKLLPALLLLAVACNNEKKDENATDLPTTTVPVAIGYSVLNMYPHDTSSYTQGLEWYDGNLYEGTGWIGKSKLLQTDAKTGKMLRSLPIDRSLFGEGITVFKDKLYQLTWQDHKVFVYDPKTFRKLQEFEWPFEGWGLTHNDTALVISTGSNNIYFVHPETFQITRTLGVTDNYGYVSDINELEWVNGYIYANIYGKDDIVKINPQTGVVEGRLNLDSILTQNGVTPDPRQIDPGYVLNGIAYNPDTQTFFVTGKQWPVMFELKIN